MRTTRHAIAVTLLMAFSTSLYGGLAFELGDRLVGSIDSVGDVDSIGFSAIEGLELKCVIQAFATEQVTVEIYDPRGALITNGSWKSKGGAKKKKKITLGLTGFYRIDVLSYPGGIGGWQIKTKAKLPSNALDQKVKIKPGAMANGAANFSVLEGAIANVQLKLKKFEGQSAQVTVTTSQGDTLLAVQVAGTTLLLDNVAFPVGGTYSINVSGFPANQSSVKVTITLNQPLGDGATVPVE